MKANGGVFVIDDFGRQHLPPRELLNRWMIPLDRGIDYLSFGSGRRIRIPFACVVVFATNLEPQGLVEEAFLRRIHYKVHVGTPGRESFEEIFRRSCERNRVGFDPRAVSWIYSEYYDAKGITPRACHAVDLVEKLHELADYLRVPVKLNSHLLAEVCKSYFMDIPLIERPAVASSRKGDLA
jgi:predicted ATPase with chaperone activity